MLTGWIPFSHDFPPHVLLLIKNDGENVVITYSSSQNQKLKWEWVEQIAENKQHCWCVVI